MSDFDIFEVKIPKDFPVDLQLMTALSACLDYYIEDVTLGELTAGLAWFESVVNRKKNKCKTA